MIFPEFTNYLQIQWFSCFPHSGEVQQLHKHKGPPTSLCSFIKLLL